MAAQQAKEGIPAQTAAILSIEELAQLLAKVASGSASVEERDLFRRSLGRIAINIDPARCRRVRRFAWLD